MENKELDIISAMIQMQTELKNPLADTKAYNYKYATLPTILDQVKPILQKFGFVLIQYFNEGYLLTRLIYKNNECFKCSIKLAEFGTDAQKLGSYITYMRRYSIITILGISAEDDDGEITKSNQPKTNQVSKTIKPVVNNTALATTKLRADIKAALTSDDLDALSERIEAARKVLKNYEIATLEKEFDLAVSRIMPKVSNKIEEANNEASNLFKDLIK